MKLALLFFCACNPWSVWFLINCAETSQDLRAGSECSDVEHRRTSYFTDLYQRHQRGRRKRHNNLIRQIKECVCVAQKHRSIPFELSSLPQSLHHVTFQAWISKKHKARETKWMKCSCDVLLLQIISPFLFIPTNRLTLNTEQAAKRRHLSMHRSGTFDRQRGLTIFVEVYRS